MNVGLSNLKQLDGSSALWDEIKEEFTDNGNTINGKLALDAGSATAPSLYFTTATQSGLYNPISGAVGICTSGGDRLHFHNTYIEPFVQVRNINGSQASPSYSFKNKSDSGLFWNSSSSGVGISHTGASIFECGIDRMNVFYPIRNTDGSREFPSYSFSGDSDSGFYRSAPNDIRISSGDTDVCGFENATFRVYKQQLNINGTVGAPAISFTNEQKSGLYRAGTNDIRFSVNNADVLELSTSKITCDQPIDSTTQPTFQWVLTANQSITASTTTDIVFSNSPTRSRGTGVSCSSNTFTVSTTGYWLVSWRFLLEAGTAGAYSVWLEIGGNRRMWQKLPFISSESVMLQSTDIIYFTANDTFILKCFQNTGGSRNIANASNNGYLTLYKIP